MSRDPKIVKAKLKGGFPHIEFLIPVHSFNGLRFDLCRYNVAMSRRLTTSPKGGFKPDGTNGKYYGNKQLPIARNHEDKKLLLDTHYPSGTMIEVLVPNTFHLPDDTQIACYHQADLALAENIIQSIGVPWKLSQKPPPGSYNRKPQYVLKVQNFIERSLEDPNWRGNGLEYDQV